MNEFEKELQRSGDVQAKKQSESLNAMIQLLPQAPPVNAFAQWLRDLERQGQQLNLGVFWQKLTKQAMEDFRPAFGQPYSTVLPIEAGSDSLLADLRQWRQGLQDPLIIRLPELSPYYVVKARNLGADAVLMTARQSSREHLQLMIEWARDLAMPAIIYCQNLSELKVATRTDAFGLLVPVGLWESCQLQLASTQFRQWCLLNDWAGLDQLRAHEQKPGVLLADNLIRAMKRGNS